MPPRRNLDETRTLLLETGTEMLQASGITASLSKISLVDVCRAAGLRTAGSGYKIWPTQEAFRTELFNHLLVVRRLDFETIDRIGLVAAGEPGAVPPLDELIRVEADARYGSWNRATQDYRINLALVLAADQDPALDEKLRASDRDLIASSARLLDALVRTNRRRWRQPFTALHAGATIAALVDGLTLRAFTTPDLVDVCLPRGTGPDGETRDWTLFACAVQFVVDAFTEDAAASESLDPSPHEAPTQQHSTPAPAESPSEQSRSGNRRSLEETRALLLTTGARMIGESRAGFTLGELDLLEVCQQAGLTTAGSAYKIWASQEDYRVELLRHVLASIVPGERTIGDVRAFLDAGPLPRFTDVIRSSTVANLELNRWANTSLYAAMWIAAHDDPVLMEGLATTDRTLLDRFSELYAFVIGRYAREWIAPFTPEHAAVMLSALVQGMSIRLRVTPELVPNALPRPTGPDGSIEDWHLFSCAVEAIIDGLSRPVNAS